MSSKPKNCLECNRYYCGFRTASEIGRSYLCPLDKDLREKEEKQSKEVNRND